MKKYKQIFVLVLNFKIWKILLLLLLLLLDIFLLLLVKKKIQFVQSKTMPYIFLLKNQISNFLMKNPVENVGKLPQINFYKYTSNSSYFIDHVPEPGGFSSYDFKPEEKLAVFSISKCKKDSTKLVGQLYFYKDDFSGADTLIYKCK